MTAPTAKVREATYARDGRQCVSCGRRDGLQWNHRESSGQGGRGSKAPKLTPADGVTSCWICNPAYEAAMQRQALMNGWKLRRNRAFSMRAHHVPFLNMNTGRWVLPDTEGHSQEVSEAVARELIAAAGGGARGDA